MAGTLYVVATPLGNLEDITLRALRVLGEVALIAAEDTRHSRKLLAHFGIRTPLTSYYDQVERQKAPRLVERLAAGDSIALICDAGTPAIADPGYHLVRAAVAAGAPVVPVPGPSAVTAALSVSGLPTDRFVFEGFVPPRPSARRQFYEALQTEQRTIVCLETGRRLAESLSDLATALGDRDLVVARELTKKFEEVQRGRVEEIRGRLGEEAVRGEVTLLIGPPSEVSAAASDEEVKRGVARLRAQGMAPAEVARVLARETGRSRREIYRIALSMRAG